MAARLRAHALSTPPAALRLGVRPWEPSFARHPGSPPAQAQIASCPLPERIFSPESAARPRPPATVVLPRRAHRQLGRNDARPGPAEPCRSRSPTIGRRKRPAPTSKGSSSPKISKKTTATISLFDPPPSRGDGSTQQRQRSAHADAPESGAHRRPTARFVNNPTIRPAHRELHSWWRGLGWCLHSQARWQAVGPSPAQLIFG